MKKNYREQRSAHALAVDRGIQAKEVHNKFSKEYKADPSQSDVDNYDTKEYIAVPTKKIKKKRKSEYIPKGKEKQELKKIFNKMKILDKYTDLKETKNVARSKTDINKWKKDPSRGDVRGIDTIPKDYLSGFIRLIQGSSGNPAITKANFSGGKMGEFRSFSRKLDKNELDLVRKTRGMKKISNVGLVRVQKGLGDEDEFSVTLHELGHSHDRNILNRKNRANGNILGSHYDEVEQFTRLKSNPYNKKTAGNTFHSYRKQQREVYANWFSSFARNPIKAKKETPNFYNKFSKGQGKPIMKQLIKFDEEHLGKMIGGKVKSLF